MFHARPEKGKGRDRFSDNSFALDVSDEVFENESIVRLPDVVEGPPVLPKLEKYPALIIGENINRALVILSRLGIACGPICGRAAFIEVGVQRMYGSSEALTLSACSTMIGFLSERDRRM